MIQSQVGKGNDSGIFADVAHDLQGPAFKDGFHPWALESDKGIFSVYFDSQAVLALDLQFQVEIHPGVGHGKMPPVQPLAEQQVGLESENPNSRHSVETCGKHPGGDGHRAPQVGGAVEIESQDFRHAVKPGITGWAQICHPYGACVEDAKEKLKYDLFYVKNMNFFFDLVIIFQTVKVVLLGKGAR